jgi:DNA-binding NtrC family response regulator
MPKQIVVIDDEKIVCNMVQRILTQEGYEVETFTDSAEALARINNKKFDLVITDLKMENIDGMDILKEVNRLYPETKVIMLAAYAPREAAIEPMGERILDFCPKPVKIEDLKRSVQKALGS